jgi:glutathionyl-hydroquinone reductase
MGYLLEGKWRQDDSDGRVQRGEFVRKGAQFRDRVTADGSSGFRAEPGRYHLYVSLACPWAHRTLIFRKLRRLEDAISISTVAPLMLENGWEFSNEAGLTPDTVNGVAFLREVYVKAKPDYTGRVTVPVLWDKKTGAIVNNESAEIIRMLNSEFDAFTDVRTDYYPAPLRAEIDAVNEIVYESINNGVYRTGFATTPEPTNTHSTSCSVGSTKWKRALRARAISRASA